MSEPSPVNGSPPASPGPHDAFGDSALEELDSISLREILDQDSRPTFIIDLDSDFVDYTESKNAIRPIFCNAALRLHDRLLDSITDAPAPDRTAGGSDPTYQEFRGWVTSVSRFDESRDVFPLTLIYQDLLWTGSTVRQRWRIISGNQCYQAASVPKGILSEGAPDEPTEGSKRPIKVNPKVPANTPVPVGHAVAPDPCTDLSSTVRSNETGQTTLMSLTQIQSPKVIASHISNPNSSNETSRSNASVTLASPERDTPDWTCIEPKGALSEHVIFARNVNWGETPLGPMASWTREFREIANLVMRNPHPCALFWGEELTMLYNEAYKNEVAGNKHPDLMGTGFSGPFSEIWDGVAPIFRECARTGVSVRKENDRLPIERYGYLEETFFSWSFIPLYGGTDKIQGFYNGPFETTYQTIDSRRMRTLRLLGESLAQARSLKHFWKCVLDSMHDNPYDVPFALLYSIADADDADTASHSSDSTISLKSCLLEGSIGIPNGHPAAHPKLDLKRSKEGFIPAFREAMRTREPTILQTRDGTLPESLLDGIKWRAFSQPCKEAVIVPVRPTNGETIFAFLLIGINPRRAYDDDYKAFATMLNRHLATSLASFLLFEDEIRRNRNAAEAAVLQREMLSQQLELQTSRMRRMTELSPSGMYLFSPEGILLEANDRYYEMTGLSKEDSGRMSFLDHISENSRPVAQRMWDHMTSDFKGRSEELQLVNPLVTPRDLAGEPIEFWVLASSLPEVGDDGRLRSVMGSIADISHMKWAQGLQERRLREVEETKRQQNEFIDITSHEMRNPLSAILICADDIRDSLSQHTFSEGDATVIQDSIEAANNIALCVQHQKSIVDDILTVSKLDSNLLLITPVPVQPVAVIRRGMSMFRPEVQAKDIQFDFCPDQSLSELQIDWVNLDPSRLLQITVNLITNAIKFTQASEKRVIAVHLAVSAEQPDLQREGFEHVTSNRNSLINITAGDDWGDGQVLYIQVKVEDTGCGLTVEEKQLLFERFSQASPRTHAHYGGSGLGLFISRQLAELHGGHIGVASVAQVGSTFGFFIQARRIDTPQRPPPSRQPSRRHTLQNPERPALAESSSASSHLTVAAIAGLPSPPPVPATSSSSARPINNPLHILIVEDNLVNQKVLAKQLRKAGCTISTANNGLEALTHIESTEYRTFGGTPLSVILMDLEMPEMNGLECVACIRNMEAEGKILRHVPVIAVTANVRGEQIATARDSGMDDVVSKPFRIPELLRKIEDLLTRLAEH
ncbi:aerobic respiration control sensor protein arcB [Lophiostoma macrostomum CBS 122681]|uniref:Aerobic respiration control sensor protein arcB n=1 Tax=Lophiostoma macrostomum CBS 122681 TaxID=1314788 RepID=A0A6A6TH03_9PLEO|nr:aerobic respiration control sensor protein arcB [Lophiostoma macrostomum CBS 122681]